MSELLNPAQRAAINHVTSPLLVLAGAGSGKTRVLTHKIAHLTERQHLPPGNVYAVTFTNKASREMRERVGKLLDKKTVKAIHMSTFHTLGLNMIRQQYETFGLKPGFSIYDESDALSLIKELMRRTYADPGQQAEQTLTQINQWKQNCLSPAQALSQAQDDQAYRAASTYTQYQQALRTYNSVDFDDLIVLPIWQLQQDAEYRELWQNKVRYLLVDEYQDTNMGQYELVRLLVGKHRGLTVVGDDDQSIYTWRGAKPENLTQLQQDFADLKVIKLEQNYRSTSRILNVANHLIKNNPHVFEKRLWSNFSGGDPVKIIACRDEEAEAQRVIGELLHHKFSKATRFQDYAILYRGNHQSRLFERVLREQTIPYSLSGSMSFFSFAEIKDILAYLRILSNPDDDNAFVRIVNTPRREIGTASVQKLAEFAAKQNLSLSVAAADSTLAQHLSTRATQNLREFSQWLENFSRQSAQSSPDVAIKQLLHELDYERWLTDSSADEISAKRKMDNVNELLDWFARLVRHDPDADLATLLAKLTLQERMEREDNNDSGDRVALMTLHAAKGLEFPHVYLIGWEENLLPHRNSIETDNIEEERRLAYVGITRAQKTLTLTYSQQRKRFGETADCTPSRFLTELPEDDIQWLKGDEQKDPVEQQQRGAAYLQQMRAMLNKGNA